jgi:hypothetical protein
VGQQYQSNSNGSEQCAIGCRQQWQQQTHLQFRVSSSRAGCDSELCHVAGLLPQQQS